MKKHCAVAGVYNSSECARRVHNELLVRCNDSTRWQRPHRLAREDVLKKYSAVARVDDAAPASCRVRRLDDCAPLVYGGSHHTLMFALIALADVDSGETRGGEQHGAASATCEQRHIKCRCERRRR